MNMLPRRNYYWLYGMSSRVVIGAIATADEAENKAMSIMDDEFKVYRLPTKDRKQAVRMIKAKLLEETRELEQSMRRFSHKGGIYV